MQGCGAGGVPGHGQVTTRLVPAASPAAGRPATRTRRSVGRGEAPGSQRPVASVQAGPARPAPSRRRGRGAAGRPGRCEPAARCRAGRRTAPAGPALGRRQRHPLVHVGAGRRCGRRSRCRRAGVQDEPVGAAAGVPGEREPAVGGGPGRVGHRYAEEPASRRTSRTRRPGRPDARRVAQRPGDVDRLPHSGRRRAGHRERAAGQDPGHRRRGPVRAHRDQPHRVVDAGCQPSSSHEVCPARR